MQDEVCLLRKGMEENAFNNTNELEKIEFLQSCISQMDRLLVKSEKECRKQVRELKKELVRKDRLLIEVKDLQLCLPLSIFRITFSKINCRGKKVSQKIRGVLKSRLIRRFRSWNNDIKGCWTNNISSLRWRRRRT